MLGGGKTTPRFSASSPGEAPLCRARPIRRIALNRTIGSFQASFNPSMNGWGSFSGRVASFAHCGGCLPFSPRCADEAAKGHGRGWPEYCVVRAYILGVLVNGTHYGNSATSPLS